MKIIQSSIVLSAENKILCFKLFANEMADDVQTDRFIGLPLGACIQDDATRMSVEVMIKSSHQRQACLILPYRCDSPTAKRWMVSHFIPLSGRQTQIDHYLLREEPFEKVIDFSFIRLRSSRHHYCKRCSHCNRVKYQHQDWLEPEEFAKHFAPSDFAVIHCVCGDCLKEFGTYQKSTLGIFEA